MNNILVTGGGGFLGKRIVQMLIEKGHNCSVVGRNDYPELVELGCICYRGDITNLSFLQGCFENVDTVFHVAALAGIWGPWENYYQTNVVGTQNVIAACKKNKVKRLIYTSTPSVVFNSEDIIQGDESLPYAKKSLCNYAKSKILAEKYVLESVNDEFRGCAIRPHLIWGPEDPHLIPRLMERGKTQKLKIVGDGENLVDISYVDNVAHAHILAAESLRTSGKANGQAYFIGEEKPVKLWGWINELFKQLDIPKIDKKVSFKVAYTIGSTLEIIFKIFRINAEPPMTRFVAEQLAKSHYFSHQKAKEDFGYFPLVSTELGMERLANWINE